MAITIEDFTRLEQPAAVIIHSLDRALYQVTVLQHGREQLLVAGCGRPFRSHNLQQVRETLQGMPVSSIALRQQSAYDEMIGQPARQEANTLELAVPLSDSTPSVDGAISGLVARDHRVANAQDSPLRINTAAFAAHFAVIDAIRRTSTRDGDVLNACTGSGENFEHAAASARVDHPCHEAGRQVRLVVGVGPHADEPRRKRSTNRHRSVPDARVRRGKPRCVHR